MKRSIFAIAILVLSTVLTISGCSNKDTSDIPPMQVYRSEVLVGEDMNLMRISQIIEKDGEYLLGYMSLNEEKYDVGTGGIVIKDGKNEVRECLKSLGNGIVSGKRGIYGYFPGYGDDPLANPGECIVFFPWDGGDAVVSALSKLRPEWVSSIRINTEPKKSFPFVETDDGALLMWDNSLIFLDTSLNATSSVKLPSKWSTMLYDDGEIWGIYVNADKKTVLVKYADGAVTDIVELPDRFTRQTGHFNGAVAIEICDGILYAYDSYGIFALRISDGVLYDVMNFLDTGIPGECISMIDRLSDGSYAIAVRLNLQSGTATLEKYTPDPTIDLSKIKTLELVCIQPESSLSSAVVDFNKSHTDVRINVTDYGMYNTTEDSSAGYNKLYLDLTTGLIYPDIMFILPSYYADMLRLDENFFVDLYPLMNGKVRKEDIYGCVKRTYEDKHGALRGIIPEFSVDMLYGRRDVIGERKTWTYPEFLDYAEALSEDEYIMENLSQENSLFELFNGTYYKAFCDGDTADFENPVFIRLLNYIKTLPTVPIQYMSTSSNGYSALMSGAITEDQLDPFADEVSAGENLYANGGIKLMTGHIQRFDRMYKSANTLGVSSLSELNFIGYPMGEGFESGIPIDTYGGIYVIPAYDGAGAAKSDEKVKAAWEFIESRLVSEFFIGSEFFTSYKPSYEKILSEYRNKKLFVIDAGGTMYLEAEDTLDENGRFRGMSGTLFELNEAEFDVIRDLLENAGIPELKSGIESFELHRIVN